MTVLLVGKGLGEMQRVSACFYFERLIFPHHDGLIQAKSDLCRVGTRLYLKIMLDRVARSMEYQIDPGIKLVIANLRGLWNALDPAGRIRAKQVVRLTRQRPLHNHGWPAGM